MPARAAPHCRSAAPSHAIRTRTRNCPETTGCGRPRAWRCAGTGSNVGMTLSPYGVARPVCNQATVSLLAARVRLAPDVRHRLVFRKSFQVLQRFFGCDRPDCGRGRNDEMRHVLTCAHEDDAFPRLRNPILLGMVQMVTHIISQRIEIGEDFFNEYSFCFRSSPPTFSATNTFGRVRRTASDIYVYKPLRFPATPAILPLMDMS